MPTQGLNVAAGPDSSHLLLTISELLCYNLPKPTIFCGCPYVSRMSILPNPQPVAEIGLMLKAKQETTYMNGMNQNAAVHYHS